jgi:hypothetical protein
MKNYWLDKKKTLLKLDYRKIRYFIRDDKLGDKMDEEYFREKLSKALNLPKDKIEGV